MDTDEPVIIQIVQQVAARKNVDPMALHPPLHDVIDTDALEALFRSADRDEGVSTVTLEFVYQGYAVRVDSSGDVHVSDSPTIETGSESQPVERSSQ
ncbi:hypothetical protein OB955_01105 [Halobacteria archaeon AArc-m2/3/4]|uniref:Halobacterial output domain-containing protein n=1 Tax=Natronoglomus mannanivorans TaxID=2979990 RepID=A0AAP3E0L7_9EURY|nr:hypothetical protein [Halobacteria archaeon AArc-xg1-1]MCU4971338.1 hypothetical protein [Halobacteria archaeon AArc-m2/3/4]